MGSDIRDEWRLSAIEQKAAKAEQALSEAHQVQQHVDSLVHSLRDCHSEISELRNRCAQMEENLRRLVEGIRNGENLTDIADQLAL